MATRTAVRNLARKDPKSLIGRAFAFSEQAHKGQQRKTGEPYFNHVLAVAETLHEWGLDEMTVAAFSISTPTSVLLVLEPVPPVPLIVSEPPPVAVDLIRPPLMKTP